MIVLSQPTDYPMFAEWWEGHGWPAVPQQILPKLGALAYEPSGLPTAAAWLYMDNSVGVAMLEWLVTNPAAPARDVLRGLRQVIGYLRQEARAMDYHTILATCRQQSLSRVLQKEGFAVTDQGVIHHLATC